MPPTAQINAAIRECLDTFEPGRSPLAHVAGYTQRLRNERDWTEEEIWKVESTVRRILATLIAEPQ